MSNGQQQYDPVAAAAVAALDTTRVSLNLAQNQTGAPQAPNQGAAFDTGIQAVRQASSVSPANVLAKGGGPGGGGGGGAPSQPNLQDLVPFQLQGGQLDITEGVAPFGGELPDPAGVFDGGVPSPPTPQDVGTPSPSPTGGGGGGGGGTTMNGGGGGDFDDAT